MMDSVWGRDKVSNRMQREFQYQVGNTVRKVTVEQEGDRFVLRIADDVLRIAARSSAPGRLDLEVEGRRLRAYAVAVGGKQQVAYDGRTWQVQHPDAPGRRVHDSIAGGGALVAAMPGRVLDVMAVEGQAVRKGETIVLLEAMKMELRVTAPVDGVVVKVNCRAGQVVERGQVLVEVAAE